MNRLKKLREDAGTSTAEMGLKLGVSQRMINRYENEEFEMSIETLNKLADIFDCSIDYLLCKEDEDVIRYKVVIDTARRGNITPEELLRIIELAKSFQHKTV